MVLQAFVYMQFIYNLQFYIFGFHCGVYKGRALFPKNTFMVHQQLHVGKEYNIEHSINYTPR